MKHPIPNHIPLENAETIALQALAFIASDAARLSNFTALTGVSLEDLHQRASELDVLAAALNALLQDEPSLLMFCANAAIQPDDFAKAAHTLQHAITTRGAQADPAKD